MIDIKIVVVEILKQNPNREFTSIELADHVFKKDTHYWKNRIQDSVNNRPMLQKISGLISQNSIKIANADKKADKKIEIKKINNKLCYMYKGEGTPKQAFPIEMNLNKDLQEQIKTIISRCINDIFNLVLSKK